MEIVLSHPAAASILERFGREAVKRSLRGLFPQARSFEPGALLSECRRRLEEQFAPEFPRVVNATGVLIHTNLGRAPLSERTRQAMAEAGDGYHAVEYDLQTGRRGSRGEKTRALFASLLKTESALVVNNNAAALLLSLAATASGREVLVSRGELVAIGGSFKIPEILEASGAKLREVGTTNRTKIDDYERGWSKSAAAVLTVHPSNYEIRGYVKRPAPEEIAAFCKKRRLIWIHDLGSGNLADLSPYGMAGEEKPAAALDAGAALICFSGDKLFGGPQAGILAGKKKLVESCRSHPLARALRCDKVTLAGVFATLSDWTAEKYGALPIYRLADVSLEDLCRRAEKIASAAPENLDARVVETKSVFGGGTTPEKTFPSIGISLDPKSISASDLLARLRGNIPPIIGRAEANRVILDLRAVFAEDDAPIERALARLEIHDKMHE